MSDDYLTLIISYHGHHETELLDGVGELFDLTLGMLPRVAGIQFEVSDRSVLDLYFNQTGVSRPWAMMGWIYALLRGG
jgi:hypothetical protein